MDRRISLAAWTPGGVRALANWGRSSQVGELVREARNTAKAQKETKRHEITQANVEFDQNGCSA